MPAARASAPTWQLIPAILDGREGLTVLPRGSFVELTTQGDRIAMIRDFFHIPYLTAECQPEIATTRNHEPQFVPT